MKSTGQPPHQNVVEPPRAGFLTLAAVSVLALGSVFTAAALEIGYAAKALIFASVSAAYLIFCFVFYFKRAPIHPSTAVAEVNAAAPTAEEIFSEETREKLRALEEASLIFGSALKPPDMFRLVANRVAEIVSFQAMTLFLAGETGLRAAHSFGAHAAEFAENQTETAKGIARRAFENRETTLDARLSLDRLYLSPAALENLKSAVAVPLWRAGEIYGVLVLYGGAENSFDREAVSLLEAASERVSPLFLSSMTFEANLNSALTDAVTGLPNERALFLVLENQIAESQRNREGRALTVLSADIKDFDRLNRIYGHATGDRILSFTAAAIKAQLRQMDFLARAAGDEFLAVLPTASDDIADAIVERIEKSFAAEAFRLDEAAIRIELNFGAASFVTDGETAAELIKIARLRKNDAKSPLKGSILQFPEKFSN